MSGRITLLLAAYRPGESAILEELIQVVAPELRRIASRLMRHERQGHTLRPTGLVNEAFLRLFNGKPAPFGDSRQFFAASVRHMRRVLTDYARMTQALKRQEPDGPPPETGSAMPSPEQLIDLSRALDELQEHQAAAAIVVELKFYGGLSIEEIAAVLETSPRSVVRTWEWARAWLHRRLSGADRASFTPLPE